MKKISITLFTKARIAGICSLILLGTGWNSLQAQDSAAAAPVVKSKPVKNTFEGNWVVDNQTVMVSLKGTLEMDIQHRFGVVSNGYSDLFGLYAPSNIRIGISYVPINKLQVGLGFCKDRLQWDLNGKYALVKQAKSGGWPVSVTYFQNIVFDTRDKKYFAASTDRISYFSQLMVARKVTEKFSVQASASFSHFNNVDGYLDKNGVVQKKMKNDNIAVSVLGRYKITQKTALIANYDQPLTQHPMGNPHPNLCFGFEFATSAHQFQVFAGNSQLILPQNNTMFNQNDYTVRQFCIGFNITRLWNF
jgi:hypothetical protein